MKPTKAGWYWKKVGTEWQPVKVSHCYYYDELGFYLFQGFARIRVKFTQASEWGERIERKKRRMKK